MSRLSESALKQLIKGGETSTIEFKLAAPRAVDLAERLCGMANARGGVVIVGVEDSTGEIVGVADDRIGETLDVILRAARQVIKPALLLDPPELEVVAIAEKKLVIAAVKPSDGPIYQAGGIFWMRRGIQTSALNALELSEMMYDRGLRNWELEPAYNATLDDINGEKVQAYLDRLAIVSRGMSRSSNCLRVWAVAESSPKLYSC
jgi:predicted HTH transcriptional regulator